MAPLRIPQVTEEDLLNFYKIHFEAYQHVQAQPSNSNLDNESGSLSVENDTVEASAGSEELPSLCPSQDEEVEDEDCLGYYPDGTKRYLTDEQIEFFRHSEVYRIIRARELAAEDQKDTENRTSSTSIDGSFKGQTSSRKPRGSGNKSAPPKETRAWLQVRIAHEDPRDPSGRTFRRIARELDEQRSGNVELDY